MVESEGILSIGGIFTVLINLVLGILDVAKFGILYNVVVNFIMFFFSGIKKQLFIIIEVVLANTDNAGTKKPTTKCQKNTHHN